MRKKTLLLLMALVVFASSLVGCQTNVENDPTTKKPVTQTTEPTTNPEPTTEEVTTEEPTTEYDPTQVEGFLGSIELPKATFEYTGDEVVIKKGYVFDISKLYNEDFTPKERAAYVKIIIKTIKNNSFGDYSKFEDVYVKPGADKATVYIEDHLLIEYTGDKNLLLKKCIDTETIIVYYVFED